MVEGGKLTFFLKVGKKCPHGHWWTSRRKHSSWAGGGIWAKWLWHKEWGLALTCASLENVHGCHSEAFGLQPEVLKARELLVTCRKMAGSSLVEWRMNGNRANLGSRREAAVPVHSAHAAWCEQERKSQQVHLEGICWPKAFELDLKTKRTCYKFIGTAYL